MKSKITLKKIAKEFDVSISTVSKALKNSHEISEELREKIQAFANYYHYKPNSLALNLRSQKTKTIGIIIPEIVHHFFTTVISGIEHIANEKGYNVMICVSNESFEKELLNMEMLANGIVDGIIVSPSKETLRKKDFKHFEALIANGMPLVMFDRTIDEVKCSKVIVDDEGGGYLATKHLIDIGCKKIAIITTEDFLTVGSQRTKGYLKAIKESDLAVRENFIICIDDKHDMNEQIAQLFSLSDPPDGIFAVNEIYAATTMKIAQKLGWNIPDELAIIGFTDGFISEFTNPPLSTVAQHGFRMGLKSFELLLDEIEHQEEGYSHRIEKISTDLILRKSTIKE
ncbi:LacI family DNA-binding transcriptional regulator [Namhaeicola litoreus]|uniref:LacI family DNA-binding transcriptional regulator n=1 Tax=Namhaeicola litoreus TaxID=1052145 RepID=A0ABW3XZ17_9FLAO